MDISAADRTTGERMNFASAHVTVKPIVDIRLDQQLVVDNQLRPFTPQQGTVVSLNHSCDHSHSSDELCKSGAVTVAVSSSGASDEVGELT